MFRIVGVVVGVCAFLLVGCARGDESGPEEESRDAAVEQDEPEACNAKTEAHCPKSELECRLTQGLCWNWTVEEDGDSRRCVRGAGICGEIIHPTDPEAFSPIMCTEGCDGDTSADGLAPWK